MNGYSSTKCKAQRHRNNKHLVHCPFASFLTKLREIYVSAKACLSVGCQKNSRDAVTAYCACVSWERDVCRTILLCYKALSLAALRLCLYRTMTGRVLVWSCESPDLSIYHHFCHGFGSYLSAKRPRFDSSPVYMKFIVDREALWQAILQVLQFSSVSITPPPLMAHNLSN